MRVGRTISAAVFVTLSYLKEPPAFISDLIIPLITFTVVQLACFYKIWRLLDVFMVSPLKPVGSAAATPLAHLVIIVIPATMVTAMMATMLGANPTSLLLILISIVIARHMGNLFGLYVYGRLADPLRTSSTASPLNLLLILLPQ